MPDYNKPIVVYGWNESNSYYVIDEKWLKENGLNMYISNVENNFSENFTYGIECFINSQNGICYINESDEENVKNIYQKYYTFQKIIYNLDENNIPKIGYYLALKSNYKSYHIQYIPDIDYDDLLSEQSTYADNFSDDDYINLDSEIDLDKYEE